MNRRIKIHPLVKYVAAAVFICICHISEAYAQEAEDNTFGGYFFCEVNHDFKSGFYVTEYLEFDHFQFSRMEAFYSRTSFGYSFLPWLKFGVNYVPLMEPGQLKHFCEIELLGTLKSGGFKVSLRERYRHGFTDSSNELRSRLKVAYMIPNSGFGVYLAPEVFTWGTEWKKTRHYVACTYNITPYLQAEVYYMFYAFRTALAEHVIGLGVNFNL